jgi:radical SAM protein with 4Fe4S-binding SPASM domain
MSNKEGAVRGIINFVDPNGSAGLGCHYMEEWVKGSRFIDIFLQRIREMRSLDHVVAFTHPNNSQELKDILDFYSIQMIENPGLNPYADNQARIISSRKWSYQNWAGCPSAYSIFDEIIAMGMVGYFTELTNPAKLVYFTPETPFFNPQAADLMVEKLNNVYEDMEFDFLCQHLPMGISAFAIGQKQLKQLNSKSVWQPNQLLMSPKAKVPIKVRSAMGFPKLDNERRSFLLRSKRDLKRLQHWNGTFDDMCELDDLPKEIQLEVTSSPHNDLCKLPSLPNFDDMPIEHIASILQTREQIDDLLLTIGDLGNLANYTQLDQLLELLTQSRPYGVHLIFDAHYVFNHIEKFRKWVQAGFDIITIRLTSLGTSPEDLVPYESLVASLSQDFCHTTINTVLNFELQKYHNNWKMIDAVQSWVDEYKISFNWVGYNDYAGQLKDNIKLPVYSPRERGPCQKVLNQMHILPNGDVSSCRQDFSGKTILGNALETSPMEVWKGKAFCNLRKETQNNWACATELCSSCKQSFFV